MRKLAVSNLNFRNENVTELELLGILL